MSEVIPFNKPSRMAEEERFELSIPFGIHAFQACALGHYATLPRLPDLLSLGLPLVALAYVSPPLGFGLPFGSATGS